MSLDELLAYRWLGNPVERWLLAIAFIVVATTVLWALKQLAVKRLTGFAKRTPTAFDDLLVDLLSRTRVLLIFVSAISPATGVLRLPADVHDTLRIASVVALLIQLAIWGNAFISLWTDRYGRRGADVSGAGTTALSTMAVIARMLLGLLLILFLLDNDAHAHAQRRRADVSEQEAVGEHDQESHAHVRAARGLPDCSDVRDAAGEAGAHPHDRA